MGSDHKYDEPFNASEKRMERVQLGCLAAMILTELLFFVAADRAGGLGYLLAERYLTVPAFIFLGVGLCRSLNRREKMLTYAAVSILALFFVIQCLHQVYDFQSRQISTFACVYALCLPFAAAAKDGERQLGLKCVAGLFLMTGLLLTICAGLLIIDAVPSWMEDYVRWDGARFQARFHPNICAALLMISSGLLCSLAFRVKVRWHCIALLVLAFIEFSVLSLTNGRTTVVFSSILLGGIVFCAIRGTGWKRAVPAAAAAAVVIISLFATSRILYQGNYSRLQQIAAQSAMAAEAETQLENVAAMLEGGQQDASQIELKAQSGQRSFAEDIKNLNGRTSIWKATVQTIRENSRTALFGTEYIELQLNNHFSNFYIYHAHNSWLQVFLSMGVFGFAAVLMLSAATLWCCALVLWRNTDLWKSSIALLVLCLMACAILEPYLFTADIEYHFFDIIFMLCVGYLFMWCGKKSSEEGQIEDV